MAKRISKPKTFRLQNTNNVADLGLITDRYRPRTENPIDYEPKRQHRFVLKLPPVFNMLSSFVIETARPSATTNALTGCISWENIEVILYDPIEPNVVQRLYESLHDGTLLHILPFELWMLDPIGIIIEKWTVAGKISYINFGTLSYNEPDEISTINLIIQPINCFLTEIQL